MDLATPSPEPRPPWYRLGLRYGFLLVFLTVPIVGLYVHMKPEPQVIGLGVLVCYSLVASLGRIDAELARPSVMGAILVVLVLQVAAITTVTKFALWLSPPISPSGHPVMAIGHVMIGGLLGGVAGLILAFVYLARGSRDARQETLVLRILSLALALALVVDRWLYAV